MEELLWGYPRFWKPMSWDWDDCCNVGRSDVCNNYLLVSSMDFQRSTGGGSAEDPPAETPLVLLQRILQGWKDMAA
jgi:hypothetical protein